MNYAKFMKTHNRSIIIYTLYLPATTIALSIHYNYTFKTMIFQTHIEIDFYNCTVFTYNGQIFHYGLK